MERIELEIISINILRCLDAKEKQELEWGKGQEKFYS